MGYEKQFFKNGETILLAEHLEHIEDGILQLETAINKREAARVGQITLRADRWQGDVSPYSQIVTVAGVTENTRVDLTPNVAQLVIFHQKDLAFVTENEDGVVTVYAIGDKPLNDYTIQVTLTEVIV